MSGRIMLDEAEEKPAPAEPDPPPPAPPPPEPAPEPPPAREAAEPAEAEAPAPDGDTPKPEAIPPQLQKRLDTLTREKYEARRQVEELQQRFEQMQRAQRPADDPEERAYQRYTAEQGQRAFNEACNAVAAKGREEFPDFDDAISTLIKVGYGQPNADGSPSPGFRAVEAIASLPDGHRVYRELASDLDNAVRILKLSPIAMAAELGRMSRVVEPQSLPPAQPAPAVTRAPEPLRSIGGTSGGSQVPLEKASWAEFIRRRDAEERRNSRISR
jgi:hypothetical protein